jgi:hypothetical protein
MPMFVALGASARHGRAANISVTVRGPCHHAGAEVSSAYMKIKWTPMRA